MRMGLPVAIIGAGPVGLAAAAHLANRDQSFVLLERGPTAGHAVAQWAHVQLFSPWRYNVDRAAESLLVSEAWTRPDPEDLPTGADLLDHYLLPLARHPAIAPHIMLGAKVVSAGRANMDKVQGRGRSDRPFELQLADGRNLTARAVIDASGTWFSPNPASAGGYRGSSETANSVRVAHGIPDVLGRERQRYSGRRVLVIGSGHSAINSLLELAELRRSATDTRIFWAVRRDSLTDLFGGGQNDALPARGALGTEARALVEAGELEVLSPFLVREFISVGDAVEVLGNLRGAEFRLAVDEVIVATGFRPDLSILREIRLSLDSWLEAPEKLAPLIDPNEHSCGTVRPHGFLELAHAEEDFYIAGMKSYGRAPTFLMTTGYEQVRSIAAALAGDHEAAARTELELPQTGICRSVPRTQVEAGQRQEVAAAPHSAGPGCCYAPSASVAEKACCR